MKASAGILIALGAALSAGSAFAQSATTSQSGATVATERTSPPANRLRVINNRETDTAQVGESPRVGPGATPVNGAGGQGGGNIQVGRDDLLTTGQSINIQVGKDDLINTGQNTFIPAAGSRVALRRNSGAPPLQIGTTDREGWVSTTLRVEPGAYEVTAACLARAPCRLASVSIDGRSLTADANGRFVLTVQAGASSLRVRVQADVATLR